MHYIPAYHPRPECNALMFSFGPDWERQLEGYDGILVPGGFGKRGINGMLNAIR